MASRYGVGDYLYEQDDEYCYYGHLTEKPDSIDGRSEPFDFTDYEMKYYWCRLVTCNAHVNDTDNPYARDLYFYEEKPIKTRGCFPVTILAKKEANDGE